MERPLVIRGCSDCNPFIDPYYKALRKERNDYVRHNAETVALIVKGGLYKVKDVLNIYPEYIDPAQLTRGYVARGPPGGVVTVVESVCCIKPRVVGRDLVYAATKPLRLEIRFAELHIDYVLDGNRYKRAWEVGRQWKVDVKLIPLREPLINFIATEKYLQHLYPIEPPDRVVVHFSDGTDAVLVFDGDKPRVELDLSRTPSLLWFVKKPDEVLKELLS